MFFQQKLVDEVIELWDGFKHQLALKINLKKTSTDCKNGIENGKLWYMHLTSTNVKITQNQEFSNYWNNKTDEDLAGLFTEFKLLGWILQTINNSLGVHS